MIFYTDGATSNNGYEDAIGGWAWIQIDNNTIISKEKGKIPKATNNICELTAVIKACEYAEKNSKELNLIYSDSAYIINCYKQEWYKKWKINGWINSKKENVKNKELWEKLIPYFENDQFNFEKVKGHSTSYFNNYVDKLAVEARING